MSKKKRTGWINFNNHSIIPFKRREEVNHYTIYGCKDKTDQYKMIKYINYLRILENKDIYHSYNEEKDMFKRYIPSLTQLEELLDLNYNWGQILNDSTHEYSFDGAVIFWIDNRGYFRETDLNWYKDQHSFQTLYHAIDFKKQEIPRCYGFTKYNKPIVVIYFIKRKKYNENYDQYQFYYCAYKLNITSNYKWIEDERT